MADKKLSLIVDLVNRTEAGFKKVYSDLDATQKRMENTTRTMKSLGAAGTVAFGALALGAGTALKQASNLTESINAVNVVFGDGADNIHAFAKSAATSVGLAASEFNQMATITGALLKDTGLPMKEVADLTSELTVRAADMASVFNTDVNDAMSAITQAIRGETEGIRRYAGNITDAELNTYALAQGINKTTSEMTEQEKRLLRVQLIMKQTAVTAGDFANTSDQLANQQRILNAQFKDIGATVGAALIPAMTDFLNAVRPLVDQFAAWAKENPNTAATVIKIGLAVSALLVVIGALGFLIPPLIVGFSGIATVATAMAGAIGLSAGAMGLAAGSFLAIAAPIAIGIAAIAAIIAIGYLLIKNWDSIKAFAISTWTTITTFVTTSVTAMGTWITSTWNAITTFFSETWAAILSGIKAAWEAIKKALMTYVFFIVGLYAMLFDLIMPGWQEKLKAMFAFFVQTWNQIKTFFGQMIQAISATWNQFTSWLSSTWTTAWNAIKSFFAAMVAPLIALFNSLKAAMTAAWQAIVAVFNWAKAMINPVFTWFNTNVKPIIDAMDKLISKAKAAKDAVTGSVGNFISSAIDRGKSVVGARASGGPVAPNRSFLVGEKGPELFTPDTFGRINANRGGGVNVTLLFQGNNFSDEDYADKIQRRIVQDLKQVMKLSVA